MLRKALLLLLLAGLPVFAQADKVDQLIRQLGSPEFAEREEATRALDGLGAAALDALKKAAKGPDAETRRRAEELIGRIERRLETARVLAPSKHALRYQETPLLDAVSDLSKRGGISVLVQGDPAKLKKTTVTLETAELEFWPAFEQFCRKAGLVEAPSVEMPLTFQKPPPPLQRQQAPPVVLPRGQFVLIEGTSPELPTWYSGAARIRALPPGTVREGPGQVVCTFGIALENGLELLKVAGVRVEKAVDDLGQSLEAVVLIGGDPTIGQPPIVIENVGGKPQARLATPGQYQVPVRLGAAAKPSTRLKELTGVLRAEIRTRPEPVAVVDNVLKAGQKVDGKNGGWLLVQQVTRGDSVITIRMEMLTGSNSRPGNGPSLGLTLTDDKGQTLPQADGATWTVLVVDGTTIHQVTARFKTTGLGEPARLIYSDARVVTLEVPFTFKDVPLR